MASTMLITTQINRLKARFGEKHFDDEFVKLIIKELMPMADGNVIRAADLFIGNRPAHKPPLLTDFREARLAEEKVRVEYAAKEAIKSFEHGPRGSLERFQQVMKPFVGHVNSVKEAIEIRKIQIQAERAKNPNYDPMTDPKWMGKT